MALSRNLISAVALCVGALCAAPSSQANQGLNKDSSPSTAAVNVAIVIPPVLRILENRHPLSLPIADTPDLRISVSQRLVLLSTLGKGFCAALELSPQLTDWALRVSGSAGAWIEPSAGGYRLCVGRAGRYEVLLQHDFTVRDSAQAGNAVALDWPVLLSLATP
jgi:hypothetical protein